jgi:hypothetical protein
MGRDERHAHLLWGHIVRLLTVSWRELVVSHLIKESGPAKSDRAAAGRLAPIVDAIVGVAFNPDITHI